MTEKQNIKKIIARGVYMLVKPTEKESNQTANGLYRPDSEEKEQKAYGTVINTGDCVEGIVAGDMVVYGAYGGETIKVQEGNEEVEYKLIHNDDVIAFIEQ